MTELVDSLSRSDATWFLFGRFWTLWPDFWPTLGLFGENCLWKLVLVWGQKKLWADKKNRFTSPLIDYVLSCFFTGGKDSGRNYRDEVLCLSCICLQVRYCTKRDNDEVMCGILWLIVLCFILLLSPGASVQCWGKNVDTNRESWTRKRRPRDCWS